MFYLAVYSLENAISNIMYQRIILLILFPLFAFSQAPQKINFQSILRNTNGEVVANKNVKLKISIQSGSMMDTTVYSETHLKTTDASGLMSLKIGTGTVIMGRFDSIKWEKAPHFIKLEADFNGGNNFELLGTQELMSVPYAFHSNTADSLVGGVNLKDIKDSLEILNMRVSSLIVVALLTQSYLNQLENQTPLTDIDGNTYQKVVIGGQIWMKENLKVSSYRNGDPIPIVTDNTTWGVLTSGGRSWYDNDSTTYEIPYGNLYNWYAASDNRNICPIGWHVPTDAEWTTLTDYLGGEVTVAGNKMKTTGFTYWNRWDQDPTNSSGFSALPGGIRYGGDGRFSNNRTNAFFWSSSVNVFDNNTAWGRGLYHINGNVGRDQANKSFGASVRCLKD